VIDVPAGTPFQLVKSRKVEFVSTVIVRHDHLENAAQS
jgi:hypothetical protein